MGAIVHNVRKHYGWPIEAEYRGPENIAYYTLRLGTDRASLRFPQSAKALGMEGGDA